MTLAHGEARALAPQRRRIRPLSPKREDALCDIHAGLLSSGRRAYQPRRPLASAAELVDHFDDADDLVVQNLQILCGDPPLAVRCVADLVDLVAVHKRRRHFELRHGAEAAFFDVPVGGDTDGVGLVGDGIEDGLLGEAGGASDGNRRRGGGRARRGRRVGRGWWSWAWSRRSLVEGEYAREAEALGEAA